MFQVNFLLKLVNSSQSVAAVNKRRAKRPYRSYSRRAAADPFQIPLCLPRMSSKKTNSYLLYAQGRERCKTVPTI